MNINDIKIFFKTLFDRSGAEEAKKAIREVSAESKKAGKDAKDAGDKKDDLLDTKKTGRSNRTVQLIGDIRQSLSGLANGLDGIVASVQGLIKIVPGVATWAGPVGIAAAAFGALGAGIRKVHEWMLKAEVALSQSKLEQLNGKLDRVTESYARLREEMEDGLATRKAYDATATEETQAKRRVEDAELELSYRQQLAALGEDQTAKDQLTADYGIAKADIALAREREDAQSKYNALLDEEDTAGKRVNALIDERTALVNLATEALAQQAYAAHRASQSFWGDTMEAFSTESQNAGERTAQILENIRKIDADIRGSRQTQDLAALKSRTVGIEKGRSEAVQGVAELDYSAANKTVQASRDKEALAALDRLEEAATGMSPEFLRGLQKVVDSLNNQKRFTAAEIDRVTRDVQIQRQRSIGF